MAVETCRSGFDELLEQRGVTRRDFLKLCGGVAVALGLSEAAVPKIAQALEENVIGRASGNLTPAIWLELASCTGCTESLGQVDTPDIASILLELISLNYTETLSAGAGWSLEEAKAKTIEAGGYLLFAEGALMQGWDGNALRIAEEKGIDIVRECAERARAIICCGSCAVDGGWQAAAPNPGGAIGVEAFLKQELAAGRFHYQGEGDLPPIINVPTCPSNPENLVAILVESLLLEALPELDKHNKPVLLYGEYIHDNCPRRGHFENGEFVYKFGSEEEKKGYCLYAMGCKGPQTKANCPVVRWNRRVSWCIESGAPCIGCAQADPTRTGFTWVDTSVPVLGRFRHLSLAGISLDPTFIAYGVGALVLGALALHGFGMKATGRTKGGAPFELERKWDIQHPQAAEGAAAAAREAARAQGIELPEAIQAAADVADATDATDAATASDNAEDADASVADEKAAPTEDNEKGGDK